MNTFAAFWLAAATVLSTPLAIEVTRERGSLSVDFALTVPLPQSFEAALPTGASVRLVYPVQLRATRKMWWDRKVWRGRVEASAVFDPVTGRYRCELVLDEIVVASEEYSAVEDARRWLVDPPPVRVSPDDQPDLNKLQVRVRAIFSSSTRWLVFPVTEGTDWVEIRFADETPTDEAPTKVAPTDTEGTAEDG